MKKIIFTLLFAASFVGTAQEKEEEKGTFTLSGTVDVYGTANFADGSGTPGILIATPESANGFGLGFANTVFAYEKGKSGVVADIAFGPRADDANMAGAINQLYAYYNVSEKVTVTAGQFNTFLGYEVISPAANFNYTVSYLFNAGPFSQTGIKLDYAASEDLSFLLAVTNGHGISSIDSNVTGDMQVGGQIGYKGQFLNVIYGATGADATNDDLYLDYTGGFNASESFYVGINAAYANSADADAGYQGAALYLQNSFSDSFALGLRSEFFQANGSSDASVTAVTLTANASLTENLKLITDLRLDSSEDAAIEVFGAEKSVAALTIAAVYSF
tara:strand:+ start:5172 stop:6167 length:996 start_codon:yes stop_codon:yes gene_type:complete